MIIDNLWRKINHLVPSPSCSTKGDEYSNIVWSDSRALPTSMELMAIEDAQIVASELNTEAQQELENNKSRKFLFEINFDQENRIRIIEGKSVITKDQYRNALINLYKSIS